MLKYLKTLEYKELFLVVFLFTFVIGTFVISLVSFFLGDIVSFFVTLFSFIGGIYTVYLYIEKKENINYIAVLLLWMIAFIVFSHIFINNFGIDVVYILLLPMTAPILLSRKALLFHGSIYLFLSILIFSYGFMTGQFTDSRSISGFGLLAFFVFLFGSTYHIAIEESYRKLAEADRQKAFLLKEIHHRVKNNLNIIASILGLEKYESDISEVHKLIKQNKLRIESIAMVHEILYESKDLEHIDFRHYILKLTQHILNTERGLHEIELFTDIVELELNMEYMMQFGIIVNELMTNSIKYAFTKECDTGKISICLEKHQYEYKFIYQDNGMGLKENKKGFGMNLIEMSVEQLDGEVHFFDNDGLVCEVFFRSES